MVYDADGVVEDLLLLFQVFLIPPILYENSLTLLKRINVLQRIGTAVIYTFSGVLFCIFIAYLIELIFESADEMVPIFLIFLLGDYSGTLDPHVSFNLNNDESLSFLGFMSIFKNSVLLFLLFNMMPDTKSESENINEKVLYAFYTLLMPIVVSLGILIPTTLAIK